VARAFSQALGRPVEVAVTPPAQWEQAFRSLGFSEAAAKSYAAMTRLTLENKEEPDKPQRGATSLGEYISALVRRSTG
jgi:hypothetical protein